MGLGGGLITELDALTQISAMGFGRLAVAGNGGQGDLITGLDALTQISAKASVALSLQRRND
jgi:hypothetical protein